MATQPQRRQASRYAVLVLLACAPVGCGTGWSYSHQDDPLLGSWNRPIVRTPPPTGGDIGNVYQGGAGVYPAPAIGQDLVPPIPGALPGNAPRPIDINATSWNFGNGSTTNASLASSKSAGTWISRFFDSSEGVAPQAGRGTNGPTIALENRFAAQPPELPTRAWAIPEGSMQVAVRKQFATSPSGSAMEAPAAVPQPLVPVAYANGEPDLRQVASVEQAQSILTSYGIQWQRLERVENGDWQYSCAVTSNPQSTFAKQYASRNADQLAAMKEVVEQVRRDR
jgi:hypothetical protein